MEWVGEGVVLSARRHGETSLILDVLTLERGRASGLVKGGARGRRGGTIQPGDQVAVRWRARLAEHLGNFRCEPVRARAARLFGDALGLLGLASALSMARLLPQDEAHPRAYEALILTLDAIGEDPDWPALYARWEIGLLEELGYGLDLGACAATGQAHDLVYVSPRSGRAVSREAGRPYHDRLFALPGFLAGQGPSDAPAALAALALSRHFFERRVLEPAGRAMPGARTRFAAVLAESTPAALGFAANEEGAR